MCGLFPCLPILGVFIFSKMVSQDEGGQVLPSSLSWIAAFISSHVAKDFCETKLFYSLVQKKVK